MDRTRSSVALLLLAACLAGCSEQVSGRQPAAPGKVESVPRLRVVGTAQDGGFPHAACRCDRCELARRDPRTERLVASLALIDSKHRVFLVDATPDIRRQFDLVRDLKPKTDRVDRAPVDGVFITHAHLGHYTGLGFLGFEAIHAREIPLYATERMADYLAANGPWSQLVDLRNVVPVKLTPGEPLPLGERLSVTAFHVPHRDEFADTVGFLFTGPAQRIFYVPDTDGWQHWETPFETWLDQHRVDVAIVDGTFFSADELPGRDISTIGHPLIVDTIERLRSRVAEGTLRVFFTHLNHSNPLLDADGTRRREIEAAGFELLDEGVELSL
jgi:pyrroloquinoline quinone biosynthesis protein B